METAAAVKGIRGLVAVDGPKIKAGVAFRAQAAHHFGEQRCAVASARFFGQHIKRYDLAPVAVILIPAAAIYGAAGNLTFR